MPKKKDSQTVVAVKHNHSECICGKSADKICRCECEVCQETNKIPAGCNCGGCNCK